MLSLAAPLEKNKQAEFRGICYLGLAIATTLLIRAALALSQSLSSPPPAEFRSLFLAPVFAFFSLAGIPSSTASCKLGVQDKLLWRSTIRSNASISRLTFALSAMLEVLAVYGM